MSARSDEPDWDAFVAALREIPSVKRACERAGIKRRQRAYERRAKDADFAAAWQDAIEDGVDLLVESCWIRAVSGWRPPTCKGCGGSGKVGGSGGAARCPDCRGRGVDEQRERPSDSLATFLLVQHRPEVYGKRDTLKIETEREIVFKFTGLDVQPVKPSESVTETSAEPAQPSSE